MKNNLILKLCSLVPLTVGLVIFIGWIFTKSSLLMLAGVYTFYAGIVICTAGLVLAVITLIKNGQRGRQTENKKVAKLIILLILNFPAGFGLLFSAFAAGTAYTVKIKNLTSHDVTDCVISGGGIRKNLGVIKPAETSGKTFWIKQDGSLVFTYRDAGGEKEIGIEDYVTNGMGGSMLIEITE